MLYVRQLLMLMFAVLVRSSFTHGALVPREVLVERRWASVRPLIQLQPAWENCSHLMTECILLFISLFQLNIVNEPSKKDKFGIAVARHVTPALTVNFCFLKQRLSQ